MKYRGFDLYPFQEQAINSIDAGHSVIVSAPTGAGKTVIAEYAIDRTLESGRRIVYTSPIKALSNQKYRDFRARYGDRVGIMTGDVTLNSGAPILIMTTEIFRNTIFEDSVRLEGIDYIVFDEVHYLGDEDRGSVWEESIIFAPQGIRFIALSATIANLQELRDWMVAVRETGVDLVHTDERPVPLHRFLFLEDDGVFEPRELKERLREARKRAPRDDDRRGGRGRGRGRDGRGRRDRPQRSGRRQDDGRRRHDLVRFLVEGERTPVLYFSFSRRKCESLARRYQRRFRLLTGAEERRVTALYDELIERYDAAGHPATETLRESVRRGVLYHHAGMLPVFKDIVERLFTSGLVKLLFTTETFALGVNMPARCVVFDSLTKFDGVDMRYITPLDYRQMAGRAGRQGIDTEGEVYAVLDPRYDSAKKIGEILHKRPAAIISRFSLGYSTILNLHRLLGDDIETAVEKSFLAFQRSSPKRPLAGLRRRLAILAERHYLEREGLTGKGAFCARINGFEIQLTELFWEGCFEDLDPTQCAILCSAIVYESRPRDGTPRLDTNPVPNRVLNRAKKRVREFRQTEGRHGAEDLVKALDFGAAGPIHAWMLGSTFTDLRRYTSMQDGDLVRSMRLTIQVMRQLAWALPSDHHVAETCRAAIRLLNRDEVDAEKQLQVVV